MTVNAVLGPQFLCINKVVTFKQNYYCCNNSKLQKQKKHVFKHQQFQALQKIQECVYNIFHFLQRKRKSKIKLIPNIYLDTLFCSKGLCFSHLFVDIRLTHRNDNLKDQEHNFVKLHYRLHLQLFGTGVYIFSN